MTGHVLALLSVFGFVALGCGDDDLSMATDGSIDACVNEASCPSGWNVMPHGDGGVACSPATDSCTNQSLCGGGSFSCIQTGCSAGCDEGEYYFPGTMPPPSNGLQYRDRRECGTFFVCGGCREGAASCSDTQVLVLDETADPRGQDTRYSCDDGLYRCEDCCPSGARPVEECSGDELCFESDCGVLCELTDFCSPPALCAAAGVENAQWGRCPNDAEVDRCRQDGCRSSGMTGERAAHCVTTCKLDARLVEAFECDPGSCEYIEDKDAWCDGGDWSGCDTLPVCDDADAQTAEFGVCPDDVECYVRSECGQTIHCQR
ncbi:MAG: hypothetical protein AB8H86_33250 [Polyangiales bacterium]